MLPDQEYTGVAVVLGTGLACFLAQWLGYTLRGPPTNPSTVWVPGGLMLAVALLTETRRWPAVITAMVAVPQARRLTARAARQLQRRSHHVS